MKVELPGESKWFADIEAGECFAFTRKQVTSVCMKVEWLSSDSVAVLWSASDDWTLPHLIAPTELAGSILHSLPSAVFVRDTQECCSRNRSALAEIRPFAFSPFHMRGGARRVLT
jgi:hypothetical protein